MVGQFHQLVNLLIATVHRIDSRAEKKVTKELIREFQRVAGKESILFRIADASPAHPDESVRKPVFPAVPGGEQTLRDLGRRRWWARRGLRG